MRLLTAICVTAIVIAFAVPALAETQNIKVSGDITVAFVGQNNTDLSDADDGSTDRGDGVDAVYGHLGTDVQTNENDDDNYFIQQVGINVEADLTDNVSTYVRIINERAWDAETQSGYADSTATTAYAGSNEAFDITLDEAYLTLKEMLYAPLTVKIGRQNIWLGKGFVMGNAGAAVWDTQGGLPIRIQEVSDATAFDSIRATLDYDPWTIDGIYAKIDDNGVEDLVNDGVDLYVVNVGYDFTKYDAEAEAYYILKHNKTGRGNTVAQVTYDTNVIHTVGLRGSFVPFDNMNVWSEGGVQFGEYSDSDGMTRQDIQASAFNIGGDYVFTDVRWTPLIGAEFTQWSGEDPEQGGDWSAWDPLYPGKFDTQFAAFRNITKLTKRDGFVPDGTGNNNGATNENQIAGFASLQPMTDVTVDGKFSYLWYDEPPTVDLSDELGHEIDGKLTYDYTEDVQFTVAAAVFVPGGFFGENQDSTASQIISAVSVDF